MTTDAPVLSSFAWKSNAELIVDVARLGYLHKDWHTLDPTYGRGTWWKKWKPTTLVTNDQVPGRATHAYDFRALPSSWAGMFDAIAYDPPYVSVGGRKTTTLPDLHDRFGLTTAPDSPAGVQGLINAGMDEMWRCLAKKGYLLIKCQNYVSSGHVWPGVFNTQLHAFAIGFKYVDQFDHIGHSSPQDKNRTRKPTPAEIKRGITEPQPVQQKHPRHNSSTLLVCQK